MNTTNFKSQINTALIILIFCFFISGCSKTDMKVSSQPVKEEPEQKEAEEKTIKTPAKAELLDAKPANRQELPIVEDTLGRAYNKFGCSLFKEVVKPGENTFVSPISISLALAMTYNGAEDKTKEEMASVLNISGFELSSFNEENEKIIKQLTSEDKSLKLSIANSLWAKKEEPFKKPFFEIARNFYKAEIANVDFMAPETVPRINSWVEEKTQDKIKNLLSKNDVNKDTLLILINALYFKGKWDIPFKEERTKERDFYLSGGDAKKVPMMSNSDEFLYSESSHCQAIQLPYSGENLKMAIFLPSKNSSLEKFLEKFSEEEWLSLLAKFRIRNGTITMPRFKMEFAIELKEVLSKLGMPTAFDKENANFRKMCELKPGENVYINKVKHKAFVEVNEEGTEAAAATAVVMQKITSIGPGKTFRMVVDRPFFFAIFDSRSNAILFMGAVEKP